MMIPYCYVTISGWYANGHSSVIGQWFPVTEIAALSEIMRGESGYGFVGIESVCADAVDNDGNVSDLRGDQITDLIGKTEDQILSQLKDWGY